jgi:hypothetical protein
MMTLLLRTIHGSRLYGLHHDGSDYDYFEVHGFDKFRSEQSIVDGVDTLRVSLDTFIRRASAGSPQALEAMWSRQAEVDLIPWRWSFQPDRSLTENLYKRTIKNFSLSPDRKRRRHAWRLNLNYSDFINYGSFNPTLSSDQIDAINLMTDSYVSPT